MRLTVNRILIGTLLLPMLLGSLILWSLSDRAENTDKVPTAVVNLDKMVSQGEGRQPIYAGRLLAGELTSPRTRDDTSLGWELTDSRDAEEGLKNGDYYAVLTIPVDFSKKLSGIQGTDPSTAGVTVRSNDSSSALVGQISQQVGDIATNKLGHTITATYLEGVLSQTGVLKKQLGEAAGGADELASGADQLSDGSGKLSDGATELGDGTQKLADGLGTLSAGSDRLAGGADKLAGGASRLEGGIGRLADGAAQVDAGADRLAGGLDQLRDSTDAIAGQADQAGQVDTRALAQGLRGLLQVSRGLQQACTSNPDFERANPQLCASADQAVTRGEGQAATLEQLGSLGDLTGGVSQLVGAVNSAANGAQQLSTGTGQLASGSRRLETGAGQLARGAGQLSTGADKLSDGAQKAERGADKLADGADALAQGADKLDDGSGKLATGAEELAKGLHEGADKIPSGGDPEQQAKVIADPVSSASSSLNGPLDGATLLTPGTLAFALWLGAFVIYLVRDGIPTGRLRSAISPSRLAWAGWWPALLLGAVQAGLLLVVTLLFGADLASPVGVVVMSLVAIAVFTAINQALTTWFGNRRGWIISIGFAALQIVSLGGLLPIDTAPGLLRVLNEFLPIARASDAISHLTLGGQVGTVASDVLVLLVWGGAAVGVTILGARRRQQVTVDDVRRELQPA
jgi:putative membrane protein